MKYISNMKNKRTGSGLLAVCLVCGLLSCKEEIVLPDLEGNLVGYVFTFDEFANPNEDHKGVLVTACGVARIDQTHTDANGRFEFRHLPAGTYELHMEKAGYGTMKEFGVQHLGGEPTILGLNFNGPNSSSAFFIYKLPTAKIINLSLKDDSLFCGFDFAGEEPDIIYLLILLSDEQNFTDDKTKEIVKLGLVNVNGDYQGILNREYLHFEAGETVYYKAAVIAWGGNPSISYNGIHGIDNYFDYESNRTVYPNTGEMSAQYSFVFQE